MKKGWHEYTVTCANCNETVKRANKTETCGMACREALRKRRALEHAPRGNCPVCGEKKPLLIKAKGEPVCSQRCKQILWGRQRRARDWATYLDRLEEHRILLEQERPCDQCGIPYIPKRYDQRFCTKQCADRWRWHHGGKGERTRGKYQEELARKNAEIGSCALCGTPHTTLLPADALGITRRNASALFHQDHIIPRIRGGTDDPGNIRMVCWFCNSARMDMSPCYDTAIAAAGRAFWQSFKEARCVRPRP